MTEKTRTELIEDLRSEWTLLLSRSNKNNLFLTWEWINSWCQNMLNQSMKPFIVTVRKKNTLIGLAPLVICQLEDGATGIQIIGQKYSYHLGFIAEAGREKQVIKAIWDYLLNNTQIEIQSIEFLHFDEDNLFESILDLGHQNCNLSYERSIQNPCKVISLQGTFYDYLHAQITSEKLKRNYLYEYKRMSKNHRIDFFDADHNNFSHYWEQMVTFHCELMKHKNVHSVLMRSGFKKHLQQVARAFLEKNKLQMNVMTIDDETAVVLFGITYNHVFNGLTIGLNLRIMQKFPWFNLTFQSLIHNIKNAIENDCEAFDLLGGHNPYKHRLGGVDQGGFKYNIYPVKKNNSENSRRFHFLSSLEKSVRRFLH